VLGDVTPAKEKAGAKMAPALKYPEINADQRL
jgi:hypothetical protein